MHATIRLYIARGGEIMSVCTFFGHRDCPEIVKPMLQKVLTDLIAEHGIDMFYVGNQGQFDAYVHSVLKELKQQFPLINYAVVLAYMPGKKSEYDDYYYADTMLPEGIEEVHPKFAISWRNDWMLQQSEYVVTYITHSWGGAFQYAQKAHNADKKVINIEV